MEFLSFSSVVLKKRKKVLNNPIKNIVKQNNLKNIIVKYTQCKLHEQSNATQQSSVVDNVQSSQGPRSVYTIASCSDVFCQVSQFLRCPLNMHILRLNEYEIFLTLNP